MFCASQAISLIITHRTDDPAKLPPVISAAAAAAGCTGIVPHAAKAKNLDPARPKLRLGAPASRGRPEYQDPAAPATIPEGPAEQQQPAATQAHAGLDAQGGAAADRQSPAAEGQPAAADGQSPAAAHPNGAPRRVCALIPPPPRCDVRFAAYSLRADHASRLRGAYGRHARRRMLRCLAPG